VYRATHELQTMLCRTVRQEADPCSRFDLDSANVCDFDRGLCLIVGLEPGAGAQLTLIHERTRGDRWSALESRHLKGRRSGAERPP